MIQSATFGKSRIEAERLGRDQLFSFVDIHKIFDNLCEKFDIFTTIPRALIIGLLEDLLLSHTHIMQKYYIEEVKKNDSFQPKFRKEANYLVSRLS